MATGVKGLLASNAGFFGGWLAAASLVFDPCQRASWGIAAWRNAVRCSVRQLWLQERARRLRNPRWLKPSRDQDIQLEQRVAKAMREHGYLVQTNPAYTDPETGKSREYDISAIQASMLDRGTTDAVFSLLVCECENNEQPIVFFTSESLLGFMNVKYSGSPVKIISGNRLLPLWEFLGTKRFHHYGHGTVATQYCTFHRKNDSARWVASHSDAHQTFLALVNAVEHGIDDHCNNWVSPGRSKERINLQMFYPLLVLQGDIYEARTDTSPLIIKEVEHVQYRKELWDGRGSKTYHLDVIAEKYVPKYLDLISKEIETVRRRLRRQRTIVYQSIEYITKQLIVNSRKRHPLPFRAFLGSGGMFD